MKKIIGLSLILLILFAVVACDFERDATQEQKLQTEVLMKESQNQIGMPNITNFFEKKIMKEILEKCDDPKLITYLYTINLEGKYVYRGRGIGFGVPYSTQYTNPQKYVKYHGVVIAQADPSGLFKSSGMSATWYLMIDEATGDYHVEYWEPCIVVKQTKVRREECCDWSLPDNY